MKKLDTIEKKNPFKTPENYFENLSGSAILNIHKESDVKTISFSKIFLRAAAIFILVITSLAITYFITNTNNENNPKSNIADISNVENYIDEASIVYLITEDSIVANDFLERNITDFQNDTTEYLAENMDYLSLLAEL